MPSSLRVPTATGSQFISLSGHHHAVFRLSLTVTTRKSPAGLPKVHDCLTGQNLSTAVATVEDPGSRIHPPGLPIDALVLQSLEGYSLMVPPSPSRICGGLEALFPRFLGLQTSTAVANR